MHEHFQFYLISAIALLFFGALASCFETAITASSRARIHRLKKEGNKRAKIVEDLLLKREKVVGTMILVNNLTSILSSVLTTSILIHAFGETGLVYATIIMTILTVVFCDITPKTLALKAPNQIALFFAPVINLVVITFVPIINFTQKIIDSFIGLFFADSKKSTSTELEEIRDAVALKHKEGFIYKYDKEMLDAVLDLSETQVSEIMIHRKDIESVNIDIEKTHLIREVLKGRHSKVPLWSGNQENIVGILDVKKLLKILHEDKQSIEEINIRNVIEEVWFSPATNSLRSQLLVFREHKKKFSLVVDEYGSLLGLITLEDILSEIVGDIKEKDRQQHLSISKVGKNIYKIAGNTLIRDINKELNWSIKESDDAYNVAGLIISTLGRIPEVKETIIIGNYNFQILEKSGSDIVFARVKQMVKRL